MTHNPFDEFAKSLVVGRQAQFGHAETEFELTRDALYADLAWEPDPTLIPRKPRDLVDRMARVASLWEFSHRAPDFLAAVTCIEKVRVWHARRVADAKRGGVAPPKRAPLWLICAGTPTRLMRAITFRSMRAWPRGFYEAPSRSSLRLVLVRELHVGPTTLLLRLMGAGVVLDRALAEVKALPEGAEERIIAEELIERIWRIRSRSEERSVEGKQFVAQVRAEHRAYVAAIEAKAHEKGIERGIEKGIEKGIERGLRIAVIAFCEAANITLDEDRRAWIERADTPALEAKLAALRATRAWT